MVSLGIIGRQNCHQGSKAPIVERVGDEAGEAVGWNQRTVGDGDQLDVRVVEHYQPVGRAEGMIRTIGYEKAQFLEHAGSRIEVGNDYDNVVEGTFAHSPRIGCVQGWSRLADYCAGKHRPTESRTS